MNISQETKDFVLEIAHNQIRTVGYTSCDSVITEIRISEKAFMRIPYELFSFVADIATTRKIITVILAQAYGNDELIADYTLYPNPTYHKKLD